MPKLKKQEEKSESKKSRIKSSTPQLLKGFKDILPSEQIYWRYVRKAAENLASTYGFDEIGLPILEELNLFVRSIGKQTDIVEKEMFSFTDKTNGSVALRPEATASVVRAYINHGMLNQPQPVKLYYWGPMFRREKPQSGRLRQFHQFGFEVIGDNNPVIDAQLVVLAYNFYKQIGLNQVSIQINSIGCSECRKAYREELINYYKAKRKVLCEDCKNRLVKNPLRLLDCKEAGCQPLKAEAPQIIDWLDEECKAHFMKVIDFLDELDIPYILNPYLVRGLDYYTKTVFEIWPDDKEQGSQDVLAGGGRYDGLVASIGGREQTPAVGFSVGIERTILQLKEKEVKMPVKSIPEIFLAQIGDSAKVKAMILFEELRQQKIKVAENFTKDGLKTQLELADKLGVKYVLILGQKEVIDGTVMIRDMESGVQEIVDFKKVINEIKKKLKNNK